MVVQYPLNRAIRQGIADKLRTISLLREVHPGFPDQINYPAAIVLDRRGSYQPTIGDRGFGRVDVEILVLAAAIGGPGIARAYEALDEFVSPEGPQSVPAALSGDLTLDGLVAAVVFPEHPEPGYRDKARITFGGIEHIGVIFDAEVHL